MTTYNFTDIVDFTRASLATYTNSSGLITNVTASKNLLTYSQAFTNGWVASKVTVTPNATTAPNGLPIAFSLTDNAENNAHNIYNTPTAPTSGGIYTYSVYVKQKTHPYVNLTLSNTTNAWVAGVFDLNSGTVSQTAIGTSANNALISTSISNEGSGWYRISITGTFTSSTINNVVIGFAPYSSTNTFDSVGNLSYSGNGTNSFYIWGAQLEATPFSNLTLGTERVVGGNFESGLLGSITNGGSPASVSTYTLNTVSPISGTQDGNVTITSSTTGGWPRITSIPDVSSKTVNTVYYLSFDYKVLSGSVGISLVFNGSSTTAISSKNGLMTGTGKFQCVYTARGTISTEAIYFDNLVGSVQIDNLSVKAVTGVTNATTSYTKNYGSVYPPRFDYDPITLQPRGFLIEEQRTNSFTYSDQFDNPVWTNTNLLPFGSGSVVNATNAPDGNLTADKIVPDTSLNFHGISKPSTTFVDATSYSISVFVKPAGYNYFSINVDSAVVSSVFSLSGNGTSSVTTGGLASSVKSVIEQMNNGWYRCTVTFTKIGTQSKTIVFSVNQSNSPEEVFAGDGVSGAYIWGAQLETGAFATSYIPTVASTVTRVADNAIISGLLYSRAVNKATGTIVVYADSITNSNAAAFGITGISDGTTLNRIYLGLRSSGGVYSAASNNGTTDFSSVSFITASPNIPFKTAVAYIINDYAACANGGTVATDNSVLVPPNTVFGIGNSAGTSFYNGHIRSIMYYPTRLTNAQIQQLTTL